MNSRFKKLLISIFLILVWLWYLFYVINNIVSDKAEKEELQRIENEKERQEEIKDKIILEKNEDVQVEKQVEVNKKIEEIKRKNNSFAYFKIENLGNFSFEEENNDLLLYFWETKIWEFNKVENNELWIKEVIWNPSYIIILIWKEKYLYNLKTKFMKKIDLDLDIEYIKSWINNLEILFKTPVWIFIYSIKDSSMEYFIFFDDFIYYKNGYLWIVLKDEDIKLKNLGFEEEKENLIIYYNPETKEKNIVYKTDIVLKKIFKRWEKIYFENNNWEEYELRNID